MMARLTTPFRFSLSTLFLLITILGVFLGLKVRQAHLQRQATVWVLDHGGTIGYEHEMMSISNRSNWDNGPPEPAAPKWLRACVGDEYFITPYSVQILRGPVGDISQLRNLPTLRTLAIYGDDVDDITPLVELQKLEALGLRCRSNCDLSPLKNLKKLKMLVVCGASYEQVEGLKKDMPDCEITTRIFPGLSY